jgi:hypothetical protein
MTTPLSVEELFKGKQFSYTEEDRDNYLLPVVNQQIENNIVGCSSYKKILAAKALPNPETVSFAALPYLPVRAFKELDLLSVPKSSVVKVLTSSGTTGQSVSKINLDAGSASLQQKALSSVMTTILGEERLPMLVVDTKSIISNRNSFSARAAGVLGMMTFGRNHSWLLDEEMELNKTLLSEFLEKYSGQKFLIFGFTFMVWKYLLNELSEGEFDLSNGILVHSGGWKKLESESVSPEEFNSTWRVKTELSQTHNFYGMVEQIGSVYIEGPDGWFYSPNYSTVLIRNPITWEIQDHGVPGVIEVISALPSSYPGNVLLTEDIGVSAPPVNDKNKLWRGPRFKVIGRVPKAELRGCSDTHENRKEN